MAASTVPAAKQAILDLLVARAELVDVGVTWGSPTENEDLLPELIYFDGPTPRRPEWRILAQPNPLDEEYVLTLQVHVRQFGDDEATAEARCWALIDEVEQAVRGDLRLGSLLHVPIEFDEQSIEGLPLSDGWIVRGTVPLVCHARI